MLYIQGGHTTKLPMASLNDQNKTEPQKALEEHIQAEYKQLTGRDYKPGLQGQAAAAAVIHSPVQSILTLKLFSQVGQQGDQEHKAVKTLLALRQNYEMPTGGDKALKDRENKSEKQRGRAKSLLPKSKMKGCFDVCGCYILHPWFIIISLVTLLNKKEQGSSRRVFRTQVHPNVWLLLTILFCVHVANGCYYCDLEVYDRQIEEFIFKQPGLIRLQMRPIVTAAEANFETIVGRHGGVITPDTLSKLFTNFQTRFDIFKNTSHAENVLEHFSQFLRECSEFLNTHMSDGLCPDNNCGLLYQLVENCVSCKATPDSPQIHNCSTPPHKLDCGQNYVQVEQGDEALLNCSLPRLMIPAWTTQYLYEWTPELNQSADSDFTTLKVTNESYMLLMNVSMEMQGTYRCSLTNHSSGTVFSRMTFLLNVTEPPEPDVNHTTEMPEGDVTPTRPSVHVTIKPGVTATPAPKPTEAPPSGGPDIVVIIIAVLTAGGGSGAGAIFLGMQWLKRRRRQQH